MISYVSSLPLLLLGFAQGQQEPLVSSPSQAHFDCGGELNPTVAGILCGAEFDSLYGTLCAALQNPGNQYLFEALNDTQATSTVWAPNNEAFENLNTVFANVQGVNMGVDDGNTMHDFLFSPKGEPILTNVLLYHVANGFIHSDQLSCDGEVTTVLGTSTTICDAAATGPIFQVRDCDYSFITMTT